MVRRGSAKIFTGRRMKFLTFVVALFGFGYAVFHYTPAGRRAWVQIKVKPVPVKNRHYEGRNTDELRDELQFKENVIAAIKQVAGDGKPVVVAACGMTRSTTVGAETVAELGKLEAEIRSLRAELASR